MDPVSIASLAALAAQTMNLTRIYVHDVRQNKEAAAELLRELDVLYHNLAQLDKFLKSETAMRPFENTSVLVTSTSACRTKLTVLHEKLHGTGGGLLSRMKWPLTSKEHRETIQELRAFAQWMQFAMSIDGCKLLSQTSAQVLETLKNQLETFQMLKSVEHRTRVLERSLENQAIEANEARIAEEREKVLDWISSFKHAQKHHDVRVRRMDGTGEWLMQDNEFQRWRSEPKPSDNVLWCHGIQGSGKSVLASLVIDRLKDTFLEESAAIAHVYFDYKDQEHQSAENMAASLLKQLAMKKAALPQAVVELYQRLKGQQRKPQQKDLEQAIVTLSRSFDRVFIIVDALDECDESNHRITFLDFLNNLRFNTSSSVFVTSRPYPHDLKKAFKGSSQVTIKANDSDLRKYIFREIQRSQAIYDIDDKFKEDIIEKVVHGAHQMFLLAVLQVKAILNEPSAGEMEDALEAMPRGLNDAFEETLQRIQKQPNKRKRLGMNTLLWISHTRRPLKVRELGEALAINLKPGATVSNAKYWQSQEMMVASCLGLVTVDEESSVIRLVHFSVQEYFRERQNRIFPSGERIIAENSITYLLYEHFAPSRTESAVRSLIRDHPFAVYAARHWGFHVRNVDDDIINILALTHLRAAPQRSCSVQISQYCQGFLDEYWSAEEVESCNELHVAASFGIERVAKELLESGRIHIDSGSKMGTTALIEAAASGHQNLIRMFVNRGADLTKENGYGTALHCAAESGWLVSISELLSTGLEVDIRDRGGRTALHCSTISGYPRAMQLLMDKGAHVDALTDARFTPLCYAVLFEQSLDIIRLLLVNKADTKIMSISGFTALHQAVDLGLEEILILILEFGANVNAQRHGNGVTSLHLAAEKNNSVVVQILLDRGADINIANDYGVTPLYAAAGNGSEEAVRLLLNKGSESIVDASDDEGLAPLHVATLGHHKDIVRMLLDVGKADVNARSDRGESALDFAFDKGCDDIALLLLEYGAVKRAGDQQHLMTGGEDAATPSIVETIELPYGCHNVVPTDSHTPDNIEDGV